MPHIYLPAGVAQRQVRAQIEATPRTLISVIAEGSAVVEGQAVTTSLVSSPVTGMSVIGYAIQVDVALHGGGEHRLDVCRMEVFEVEDGTGKIEVQPSGATLLLGHEYSVNSVDVGSAASAIRTLLRGRLERELVNRWTGEFIWHEFYLQPGEPVLICGATYPTIGTAIEAPTYRQNAYKLHFRWGESTPLIIADMERAELLGVLRPPAQGQGG